MTTLTASEARADLYRLMDQAAQSHSPIFISGKRNNAVLVSEEDWSAIRGSASPYFAVPKRLALGAMVPTGQ